MTRVLLALGALCCVILPARAGQILLRQVAAQSVAQSKLTLPGSAPFHLKAEIAEKGYPDSDYRGDVEIFWASPEKWRRIIHSPNFSQTLVVNGEEASEQDTGDYYPFGLRELVTAMVDPLPMLKSLENTSASIADPGTGVSMACARFQSDEGVPPAQISDFYVFCFEGKPPRVESVVIPGYSVEFKNYQRFGEKDVARLLVSDPEPGTTIEARITELSKLKDLDPTLFAVSQPTPKVKQLENVQISQEALRGLALQNPPINWPPVRAGRTSGAMSMYVSIDTKGRVRETFPLNSDNSDLDDAAREQVETWRFKPAVLDGAPVQVEGILTFAFNTKIKNPAPILSNQEGRKLATYTVEPVFPPGVVPPGTLVTVRAQLDADGKLIGVDNPNHVPSSLFFPAYQALTKWKFEPYMKHGKPDQCVADITFRVP